MVCVAKDGLFCAVPIRWIYLWMARREGYFWRWVLPFWGKGGGERRGFVYRGRVTSELMFQLRHCVRFKQVVRSRRGHFYVILCHLVSMLLDASCGKGYLVRRLHVAVVGKGG